MKTTSKQKEIKNMKTTSKQKRYIEWPWQATMAIDIFLLAFLPGIAGFVVFGMRGSNDAATVAVLSMQAVSIVAVLASWWAETKIEYFAKLLTKKIENMRCEG